jgi:hypothetical protein
VVEVVFESVGELAGVCSGVFEVWFEEFDQVVDVFGGMGVVDDLDGVGPEFVCEVPYPLLRFADCSDSGVFGRLACGDACGGRDRPGQGGTRGRSLWCRAACWGRRPSDGRMSLMDSLFAGLAQGVVVEAERVGMSAETISGYRYSCRAVERYCADRGEARLTPQTVESFAAEQDARSRRGEIGRKHKSLLVKAASAMLEFQLSGRVEWRPARRLPPMDGPSGRWSNRSSGGPPNAWRPGRWTCSSGTPAGSWPIWTAPEWPGWAGCRSATCAGS